MNAPLINHLFIHSCLYIGILNINESESESRSVVSDSLRPRGPYSPWNSPARILEWVAFPFSRESSQPRDRTQVSCIGNCSLPLAPPGKPFYMVLHGDLIHICGSAGKESAFNEGDLGLIPGLGRSPGEGKGYPLQYSGWRIPWTIQSMELQRVRHD